MPKLLFRNAHPGVALVLVAVAALLSMVLNRLMQQPISIGLALSAGLGAWFLNYVLVYRSRYLKMNYLFGWLWFAAAFALCSGRQGIQWHTVGGSIAAAAWMALAYEMSSDDRSALTRRINLGFITGLLLLWNVRFSYFLIVSLWAIGWGTSRSGRGFLQLLMGWLVPAAAIATYRWTIGGPESFCMDCSAAAKIGMVSAQHWRGSFGLWALDGNSANPSSGGFGQAVQAARTIPLLVGHLGCGRLADCPSRRSHQRGLGCFCHSAAAQPAGLLA